MNKNNVDQALAALADALKSNESGSFLDNPKEFVRKIPNRSLTGDHINGGKIQNFSSTGITDSATATVLTITDNGLVFDTVTKGFKIEGSTPLLVENIMSGLICADVMECDVLQAKRVECDIEYKNNTPIMFSEDIEGKGILWSGKGYTKQLIFAANPDRLFLSENLDIAKGKSISINNLKIIDETSLGTSITKSYLREVGRLNGLVVDGSASISNYFYFDGHSNRLGIGTEQPNAAISIVENDIELVIGTKDNNRAYIGTFASHSLDLISDGQNRISISSDGNIVLGNFKSLPIQVSVNGCLAIKVNNPDPDVDLHVNGAIKFKGKLQSRGNGIPDGGSFNKGDVVWNDEPRLGSYIGWVCVQPGSPGLWEPFGKIGHQ